MSENPNTQANEVELAKKAPRSLPVAQKGIKTGNDFANLMSCLISDVIEGKVTPQVGNAACNAGGKLLKVVDMQFKYGTKGPGLGPRTLMLSVEENHAAGDSDGQT